MSPVAKRITELGIVLVVRAEKADERMMAAIRAVVEGGVEAVEITFSVPGAVSVIEKLKDEFGDQVLLGAGTVLNPSDAVAAVNAGARYVVSPSTNVEVVSITRRLDAAPIPGAFTPTEIVNAWNAGAEIVKVFPASVGGPAYVKALRRPLPHIPLLPTGGVTVENAADYIRAGAVALAVGGNLFDRKLIAAGDTDGIRERAAAFVEAVKMARG
jgi:2-dehydro-3-deoxyphosphogluconate aldolase/(4S)-4-hydroxy-2-oxoglutarate aldolase